MDVFLFHRDLRLEDNTALIEQLKAKKKVNCIFIFTPEQIDKNSYKSDNSVQFMIESLIELDQEIRKHSGRLNLFYGDTLTILKSLDVASLGFNLDYTNYALNRDKKIEKYCNKKGIETFFYQDYLLHDLEEDEKNYVVFSPFYKKYSKKKVNSVQKFNFKSCFGKISKKQFTFEQARKFYTENPDISVHGGRKAALQLLRRKLDDYSSKRDFLTYQTTKLSAALHFGTCSIREAYQAFKNNSGIVRELHFRDFYARIIYYFPKILQGQISGKNHAYNDRFDDIKWKTSSKEFNKWKKAKTGFPIVDACMTQLLTTGYLHNRGRMIVASFLVKDLHIDWRSGEKFFAQHLVDYDPSSNSQGWQFSSGVGPDSKWFRIFNPWLQQQKYDPKSEYIKNWLPELSDVTTKDLNKWYLSEIRDKYPDVNYPKPIVDHATQISITKKMYK